MGNENLQQVIGDLIELVNSLDVSANDGFLLFEDSDGSINFDITQVAKGKK